MGASTSNPVRSFSATSPPPRRRPIRGTDDRARDARYRRSARFGIGAAGVRRIASVVAGGTGDLGNILVTLFVLLLAVGLGFGAIIWFGSDAIARWTGISDTVGAEGAVGLIRACGPWFVVSLGLTVPGVAARALQAFQLIAIMQTASIVFYLELRVAAHNSGQARRGRDLDGRGPKRHHLRHHAARNSLENILERIEISIRSGLFRSDWRFSAGMFASRGCGRHRLPGRSHPGLGSGFARHRWPVLAVHERSEQDDRRCRCLLTALVCSPCGAHQHFRPPKRAGRLLLHALDRAIATLLLPLLLPAMFLARSFLELWVGSYATDELTLALRILLVAFAVPAFAVPVSNILAGTGNSALPARFAWLTVFVLPMTSVMLLVPRYGLAGAATAMLLANSTSFLFAIVGHRALRPRPGPHDRPLSCWHTHRRSRATCALAGARKDGDGLDHASGSRHRHLDPVLHRACNRRRAQPPEERECSPGHADGSLRSAADIVTFTRV